MDPHREILLRELRLFETAAERQARGELVPDESLLARVREELRIRNSRQDLEHEHLRRELGSGERRIWEFLLLPLPRTHWGAVPIPGWAFLLMGAGVWLIIAPEMILPIAGFLALVVLGKLSMDAWERRHYHSLRTPCCGNCGYSMRGAVDALPAALVGAHSGPRCCPECALPWPCIPGPVD